MDFQEIVKKNGERVVFCKFENLIPEAFDGKTIEAVEAEFSGKEEYIGHCPFCKGEGHTKHKLYIKSDLSVGHCFVCGRAFVNINDDVGFETDAPSFFENSAFNSRSLNLETLSDPVWTIDKYYTEFDDYSEKGIQYLIGRHGFMKELWKILEFKFLNDNIVIPFKYNSKVFYYQIRFSSGNSSIRYFHPHIKTGCKPPYIIEVGEKKNFIICEGVFDAISLLIQAPGYTPFAVLGSDITDYQMAFLREYLPEKILVYMDETRISVKIANKLKEVINYCPIGIIRSDGEDPEECMKRRMREGRDIFWIK